MSEGQQPENGDGEINSGSIAWAETAVNMASSDLDCLILPSPR